MPAIRDWTFNYTTTTSGTTISAPLPAYQAGDLLLAILSSDTTAGTWSSTGWTQLFSTVNTSGLAVFWKIAGASETDPTFTATTAETYNLHLLAIRDVNTSTPFNGTGGAGTGYRTATNSAARAAMPVLTTTVANSLILYINSESGTVVPGVLEGPCTWEDASDGTAHSDGFSWGFQPTAGNTPSTVYANKNGTAAGVLATIGISPPAGGATVIPPYCAADASVYVDPIHGTTAYNGNTAFAATLTTNFGTSINGKTAANGTAAAAADVGINSFHSMGQITGTTTAGTWAGAALVLATANKPNVAGKNILVHVKPSTPKVYQNTDPITKAGVKGVCFGMASTATSAWKMWHVHGTGTPWDSAQHVPVVINSLNTSGVIQSTGSLNAASIASFGFAVSGFTVAPVFQFGSLWVLDTTTISGGNAAEPVTVSGINKVCSTGKERMSILQQGAGQILVLQPVQFGDGGSNPIYLRLDSTAIEFPQHYNLGTRQVFYCSADNVAGLTYYAGGADTILHTNSVVTSESPYHWRIHPSSHIGATYDFSGLQVIGAGDVQLQALTAPFAFMTFTKCGTITANGAKLEDSEVKYSVAAIGAVVTAYPERIKRTLFTSSGTGHALQLTTPGTYNFEGNQFVGYASSNGSTGNEAIYNNSGGNIVLNITGGGSIPSVRNGAGATTSIINTVPIVLTNVVVGSRYRIYRASDGVLVFDGNAIASTVTLNYPYTGDTAVRIRVRNSPAIPPRYLAFETQGTVTASGLSVYVNQVIDPVASSLTVLDVAITGSSAPEAQSNTVYTVTNVAGATYAWEVMAGPASIVSGQGTTSLTVTGSSAGAVGLRCVVAKTGAMGIAMKTDIVMTSLPPIPVVISGPTTGVINQSLTFSATANAGATYLWEVTSGTATISSGQGTSSVQVTSASAGDFTIKCTESGAGYASNFDTRTCTLAAAPPLQAKTFQITQGSTKQQTGVVVNAGDLIVVTSTHDDNIDTTAITDNAAGGSNTYQAVGAGTFYASGAGATHLKSFYAIAKASETLTISATTTSTTYPSVSVVVIQGCKADLATVLDQYAYDAQEGAASTAHTSASITTTNADDIILCIWAEDTASSGITENGTGFTEMPGAIDSYTNAACTTALYRIVTATGTYSDTVTSSASTFFGNVIMAFKKA